MPIQNINTVTNLSNLKSSKLDKKILNNKNTLSNKLEDTQKKDNIFISNEAKKMKNLKSLTDKIITKIEESQNLRLEQIKLNLKSGFYDNDFVINQIAENILDTEI